MKTFKQYNESKNSRINKLLKKIGEGLMLTPEEEEELEQFKKINLVENIGSGHKSGGTPINPKGIDISSGSPNNRELYTIICGEESFLIEKSALNYLKQSHKNIIKEIDDDVYEFTNNKPGLLSLILTKRGFKLIK